MTFDTDERGHRQHWDMHFRRLEQTRTNIERERWETQIRTRYQQGREKFLSSRDS